MPSSASKCKHIDNLGTITAIMDSLILQKFLLAILHLHLLSFLLVTGSTPSLESQGIALLQWRGSLRSQGSLPSWNLSSSDPCKWSGVTCNTTTGEYQEKINSCKEKIDKAKAETVADDELNVLQNEMEENLQDEQQLRQDLRAVHDELDKLDRQRASIEERKDAVKKKEKDMMKAQNTLSMCVSVTNIMPDFEDQDKISGYIVDKNMKKIEKFEFEKTTSPVEVCNKLWKMI